MKLPPDWSEFIALLNVHQVRYLIVGAHALAASGRPRATQDIDFFVDPSVENAERLGRVLVEFGFSALAGEAQLFADPPRMATLGRPPLRIDVMNAIDGVTFEQAWAGRLEAPFGEHTVCFLGPAELRQNKRASGRPKDLADIALLDEMQSSFDNE